MQDLTLTTGPAPTTGPGAATGGGCACCCTPAAQPAETQSAAAQGPSAAYGVAGMTCGGCAGSVRDALSALPGVTAVDIALVPGGTSTVEVTATSPLDAAVVRAAVAGAGYDLVDPAS